jgi:hypothetical protein
MKGQTIERPRGKVGFLCGRNRDALRSVLVAMLVLITLATYANAQTGGTWTPLTNAFKGGYPDAALLLTDGTVLVHDGYSLRDWYKLTPDAFGSYINGQWSQVASIPNTFDYAPLFFFSAVLPTGQVIIEGSEYNFTVTQYPDHGAIYDPVKDSWTQVFPPDFGDTCAQDGTPGGGTYWCSVGESPSGVLPDGSFLVSDASDTTSSGLSKLEALLPPPYTGPWIQTGFGKRDGNTEQGFTLLPVPPGLSQDPHISLGMTVDTYHGFGGWGTLPTPICAGVPAGSSGWHSSEIYTITDTSLGQWSCLGDTQVQLWSADDSGPPGTRLSDDEMGPAILRPDGTVFQAGANSNGTTAILGTNYEWTAGPTFPLDSQGRRLRMEDGPAALLPNGNVLMMAALGRDSINTTYMGPCTFFELTYGTNQLVEVPGVSRAKDCTGSSFGEMLVLPTGQILFSPNRGDGSYWNNGPNKIIEIYTPTNQAYDPSWAPQICNGDCGDSIILTGPNFGGSISGKRFNGMSQAAAFGDEYQSATNYPLLRLTFYNGPVPVIYCRTHDISYMGVATGDLSVSFSFDCPSLPPGADGVLQVVANGIPSNPQGINVVPPTVQ